MRVRICSAERRAPLRLEAAPFLAFAEKILRGQSKGSEGKRIDRRGGGHYNTSQKEKGGGARGKEKQDGRRGHERRR